jgi:hypothetical protein
MQKFEIKAQIATDERDFITFTDNEHSGKCRVLSNNTAGNFHCAKNVSTFSGSSFGIYFDPSSLTRW